MNFLKFLADRLLYIILYFAGTLLVMLIIWLTLVLEGVSPVKLNIQYAFICSAVLFIIAVSIDYTHKRQFYRKLGDFSKQAVALETAFNLDSPGMNHEQKLYRETLQNNYRVYKDNLSRLEDAYRQQIYFMNQWAHQMKTPVSVINLLLQENQDTDLVDTLNSIREENERLSHNLDMALNTVRLSQFNLDFKAERLDALKIIRDIINENKKALIRFGIYPVISGPEELFIETDAKWIRFVFSQIITNAIKYSRPAAREKKTLTVKVVDGENSSVVSIRDEGIGIPQQDLSRVFKPFFTGENGRKFPESTGMGMYLSKKICDELGHVLKVESTEGEGTVFTVTFGGKNSLYRLES